MKKKAPSFNSRALRFLFGLLGVLVIIWGAAGYQMAGPSENIPKVVSNPLLPETGTPIVKVQPQPLRVITLNLAHGRGNSMTRLISSRENAHENLRSAADLLKKKVPHIVALQEVDVTSFISGRFNHLQDLGRLSEMKFALHGEHVSMKELSYGTGFLSTLRLKAPYSITFNPTPFRLTKGFVVATIQWPGDPSLSVDLVSVHFDFLLSSTRDQQAETMIDLLQKRGHPVIMMGDLNSDWQSATSVVKKLAHRLQLKAYQPEIDQTATFPRTGKRIDWILISKTFKFLNYEVVPDSVSDHLAVTADILPLKEIPSKK